MKLFPRLGRNWMGIWLGLAALRGFFVAIPAAMRTLGTKTALPTVYPPLCSWKLWFIFSVIAWGCTAKVSADVGANSNVIAIAIQADGKIIIGGDFTTYNGIPRTRVARLNTDGSLDTTFNPSAGTNDRVHAAAIQSDGKIIIGGDFTSYDGVARNRVARLNTDGSPDATFDPGIGANRGVQGIAVQSDGKIIIGGLFTSYNGAVRNYVARLNNNGSLDTAFDPGTGPDGVIYSIAPSSGGQIVIGGPFHNCDGASRNNIARLNANGSLDTVFDPGTGTSYPGGGADSFVAAIVVQSDGTIVIAGFFNNYNGVSRSCVARLNTNGSLDTTFNPGTGASNALYAAVVQSDGKIVIGGQLTFYNGVSTNHIARVNTDGSRDTGFNEGTGASAEVDGIALQSDSKIIIGGGFTNYNGVSRNRIARLNSDGTSDATFDVAPPPSDPTLVPVITNPHDLNVLGTNEAFDPMANPPWTTKSSIPIPRDSFALAVVSGKIYVAGGEAQNNCSPLDSLEEYNPSTDTWTPKTAIPPAPGRPFAPWRAAAGTINNIMYMVGGSTGCSTGAVGLVQAYDPLTNAWTTKTAMPTARFSLGVGVLDGILYAIGGDDSSETAVSTVEAFDPLGNGGMGSWTTKTPMPTARRNPVIAAIGGKLYAIGGNDQINHGALLVVEEFDPLANGGLGSWLGKTSMPAPTQDGAAGAVVNNMVYVVGGTGPTPPETTVSTVQVYNALNDQWLTAPDMLTPRTALGAEVVNNTLYAVGGFQAGAATVGQLFVYQITATNNPTNYGASVLPPGLSFDTAQGLLYGSPTSPSDTFIQFTATNSSGTGSALLRLTVHAAPPTGPLIVSSTSVTGRTSQPFKSFQLYTSGGSPSTHFTVGGLPPGLSADASTGLISGTATSDGNFGLAVSAIDGSAKTHATLQLTFVSDATVPIITSSDNVAIVPGKDFSYTITATPAANFNYIGLDGVKNGALPAGLAFNSQTATISGKYTGNHVAPDVIKKEPPLAIIQPTASNLSNPALTGTSPLNFFVPEIAAMTKMPNGHVLLQFVGVPLKNHDLEASTDLVHYTYVTTLQADGNGKFSYEDATPGTFYRVVYTNGSGSGAKNAGLTRRRRR